MANREEVFKDVIKKNPKLLKDMMNCPEPSKLMVLLKDKGVDITETEASKIMRALNFYDVTSDIDDNKESEPPRKLDDEDLGNTSGGLVGEIAFICEVLKTGREFYKDYKDWKMTNEQEKEA